MHRVTLTLVQLRDHMTDLGQAVDVPGALLGAYRDRVRRCHEDHGYSHGLSAVVVACAALVLVGCGGSNSPQHLTVRGDTPPAPTLSAARGGAVAFVLGGSTDPEDAVSHPSGVGVATGLLDGPLRVSEARFSGGVASVGWLSSRRVIAATSTGPDGVPARVFAVREGQLAATSAAPLRAGESTFAWSARGAIVATEPVRTVSCGPGAVVHGCYTSGGAVLIERADGSDRHVVARGALRGWTPGGQLLVFRGANTEFSAGSYEAVNVQHPRRSVVLSSRAIARFARVPKATLGGLAYSADGRYVAALATLRGRPKLARLPLGEARVIVIARPGGQILRMITSRVVISMLAWSPQGDRLAFTTSGFSAPHELYVLAGPASRPRRILSQVSHFDWITWSPDSRWLLLDNEFMRTWDLLRITGHRAVAPFGGTSVPVRHLRRLGSQPVWCCAANSYAGH